MQTLFKTILFGLAAILAPYITPYPEHVGAVVNFRARHLPPSGEYWFGTDNVGRDLFTRTVFGMRISLLLALVVLGTAVPFGTVLGLLAGYFGGWTETIIMRLTDIALAIPPLVMALAVAAVLSPDLINSMLAIAALWWTWHTRLIYSITRQLRGQEFVEAAETLGASKFHILFREILPNCVSALAVKTSLDCGFVILVGASLSFLGLGIQPPTPDLGTMEERAMMLSMWPGGVQPRTAPATVSRDKRGRIVLQSQTPGASIEYRWRGEAEPGRWSLYTGPLEPGAGEAIETRAIRYGYAASDVADHKLDGRSGN